MENVNYFNYLRTKCRFIENHVLKISLYFRDVNLICHFFNQRASTVSL